jgi:hypothetical protein
METPSPLQTRAAKKAAKTAAEKIPPIKNGETHDESENDSVE